MRPFSNTEKYIRLQLRHNVTVNLLDGTFFGVGFGFAYLATVIPLFVASLTDSAILIGLAPALHAIGWQLPQLFTASRVKRARMYKPIVLLNTIHERVPFLALAITALLIPVIGVKVALVASLIALAWQGLGGGFAANAWMSMITKIMPPESRGTFFGIQSGLANLAVSIAAIGAGYLLDWIAYPQDYAICFFITSIAMTISYIFLAQTREPEDTEKFIAVEETHFWHDAQNILRRDHNFSWYLVARTLSMFGTMAFGFYILYGLRRFAMDDITAGYLTAALTITATFANAGMGWLGDKWGHRSMLIVGMLATVGSTLLAWSASSLNWLYPVLILSGIANVSIWTIGITFTVGFGDESERPTYIGLSNTLITPATIFAPLLGGWMVDHISFGATFGLSTFVAIFTALILIFIVKDPQKLADSLAVV